MFKTSVGFFVGQNVYGIQIHLFDIVQGSGHMHACHIEMCIRDSPELFQLDENKVPREVSGCPPDGFSADGQLWGNPLFDWEYMAGDGYSWWADRIGYLCRVYDVCLLYTSR